MTEASDGTRPMVAGFGVAYKLTRPWFDIHARDAAEFCCSVFPQFDVAAIEAAARA